MASTSASRSRASNEQLRGMLDFFDENPGLASGKFMQAYGRIEMGRKWDEMASRLNAMGGGQKTSEQWRKTWRDLKCRTGNRVQERLNQQTETGNIPINQPPLSDVELRVAELIGPEYFQGNKEVAENVPSDEESQLKMEKEDEAIQTDNPFETVWSMGRSECSTPETPAVPPTAPQRILKRKREDETSDLQKKFLDIAQQHADSLKMFAEGFTRFVKLQERREEERKQEREKYGECIKAVADALYNLSKSLGSK